LECSYFAPLSILKKNKVVLKRVEISLHYVSVALGEKIMIHPPIAQTMLRQGAYKWQK